MRKRKWFKIIRGCLGIMMTGILLTAKLLPVCAADVEKANRMNVVFVLDQSGSMSESDSEELRYEAVDLFMGLSTEQGNYMGAVVFDDTIILQQDIREMSGRNDKEALSDSIRAAQSDGYTDIGKAVDLATTMLIDDGNASLPSAVILLSDGNTELSGGTSGEAFDVSAADKQNAIDTARNNGIKIHSVCLNADGTAKVSELQDISDATGGTCVEVESAEDLKNVFSQFYDIIYSTETIELANTTIPESGELNVAFKIPMFGVEEANIIINTLNPDTVYNLTNPDGHGYTRAEMEDMEIKAKTFTIIKMQSPTAGDWNLIVRGISGDQVIVDMVYNTDLSLILEPDLDLGSVNIGDAVQIRAHLLNEGNRVDNAEAYTQYPVILTVNNITAGSTEENEMNPNGMECDYNVIFGDEGDYELQAYCQVEGLTVKSEILSVSPSLPKQQPSPQPQPPSTPPVCLATPIEISKWIMPFEKTIAEDMSIYFSDAEDAELSYKITDTEMNVDAAVINGTSLELAVKECGRGGQLTIEATDSSGLSVTGIVIVKFRSVMLVIAGILSAILLIIVFLIALKKAKAANKVIRGRIQVMGFSENGFLGPSETFDGAKGKMYLGRYVDYREDVGVNFSQTYLIAGEKTNYIYLISRDGYYTDMNPDTKLKKIRLDAEMELTVTSDIDRIKGLRITYIPDDLGY